MRVADAPWSRIALRRTALFSAALLIVWAALGGRITAIAQVQLDLDAASTETLQPRVARPRGATLRLLDRLERLAEQQAWRELGEVAEELLAVSEGGWVPNGPHLYMGIREAVHRRLAALPGEGLAAYRERVDPLAGEWLRRGQANRDERLLRRVVDEAFCSSAGDEALWALGEVALERGDYQQARTAWQRIHHDLAGGALLAYPDSSIPVAEVRARLALVSIREGDLRRAKREVDELSARHPEAEGRLAGRQVNLAARLRELLDEAAGWPPAEAADGDWPTLLANSQRTGISQVSPPTSTGYEQAWTAELSAPASDERFSVKPQVYPTIVNGETLYHDAAGIRAAALDATQDLVENRRLFSADGSAPPGERLITVDAGRAFAIVPKRSRSGDELTSRLIGLDLERDGALVFDQSPETDGALFAGPVIVEGSRVVACELSPAQGINVSLVCYDVWTGDVVWQRLLGWSYDPHAGDRPTVGAAMSLDGGVLYINTNLGMIAAVRLEDGEPLWLRVYERSFPDAEAAAAAPRFRGSNPCTVVGSQVFAAPDDAAELMALDAASGVQQWSAPRPAVGARILAADGERVILAGERMWSFAADTGQIEPSWGADLSGGAGQGAVAGDIIFWPTTSGIQLVDRLAGKALSQPLPLPAGGGANLVVGRGRDPERTVLAAAGPSTLTVFQSTDKEPGPARTAE